MSELPEGWALATVDELAETSLGKMLDAKQQTGQYPTPYLRNINVRWGSFDLSDVAEMDVAPHELDRVLAQPGDVIACEGGEPGRAAVWRGEPIAIQKALHRIRPAAGISPDYLAYVLRATASTKQLDRLFTGTTIKHLPQEKLRKVQVALAPKPEQERIVAAIEEAFSKLDAGEAGLRTVRQLLKRMRDAILTAAVTGRLVPQDPTDTPATKLLADLGTQAFPSELLATVPPTWAPTTLGDVAAMSLGKMLDAKAQSGEHPKRYLRNINVRWDSFDLSDLAFMDIRPEEFDRVAVTDGDLVVCEGGQPGRCAVWRGEPIAIQKALHRVRPKHGVSGAYLSLVVRWWVTRPEYERFITGTTIKHIPKEKLRLLPVPLPPSEEQARIVTEVERQLSFVDACERAVDAGLARSAALRRSVLKAAFEGRLVPQDPSDEPASVLLERIRAERAAAPGQQGKRRKKAEAS
jgi:type I restriction enzyme S subunit